MVKMERIIQQRDVNLIFEVLIENYCDVDSRLLPIARPMLALIEKTGIDYKITKSNLIYFHCYPTYVGFTLVVN